MHNKMEKFITQKRQLRHAHGEQRNTVKYPTIS